MFCEKKPSWRQSTKKGGRNALSWIVAKTASFSFFTQKTCVKSERDGAVYNRPILDLKSILGKKWNEKKCNCLGLDSLPNFYDLQEH